jgi:predicted enzyme related to lactoylglutathione lyase
MNNPSLPEADKRIWTEWFEIPANDFERAKKFYETIFEIEIETTNFGGFKMGIFPHKEVGCSICFGEGYEAGPQGSLVYLNANPDLEIVLKRVEKAGGRIIQSKKQISPEYGFMALFLDSEGNKLGLHSIK